MPEPRYILIDTETGKQAGISTDELQRVLWSIELGKSPGEGAYFEELKRPRPSNYTVPQV